MEKQNTDKKHIHDIIQVEDHAFNIENIECIAEDAGIRNYYEKRYRGCLYSSILMSLTHESFSEDEALALWEEIVSHMKTLNQALGRNVGISVASMDYLSNIKDELAGPKIIEESKSTFVAEATTRDELTGLYVREVFQTVLKKETAEAERNGKSFCLLLMDIDDFKDVNDQYGHQRGDEVLQKIGEMINSSIREMDLGARYGGEELVVVMPDTDIERALEIAERIRAAIQALPFEAFTVTVSIGVCQYSRHANTADQLIQSVDKALYRAKKHGKNQVKQCRYDHKAQ